MSAAHAYSMTGFASAQGATEEGVGFTLAMKSVNHRFLDLHMRLPSECDAIELALRRMAKERIKRGHVEITLHVDRGAREGLQTMRLNRELLAGCIAAFHEAAELHGIEADPELHEMLRLPGVLSTDAAVERGEKGRGAGLESAVLAMAPGVFARFNEVRGVEGAALAAELRASMLRLRGLAAEAVELRAGAREAHYERLRNRIAELMGNTEASDQRLLAEAAMLVERGDIEEELVRLRAHVESFLAMLDAGGELGKRLDFLSQELNREANTMLSKTAGSAGLRLTSVGLEMKAEIEKAREQVQNLE